MVFLSGSVSLEKLAPQGDSLSSTYPRMLVRFGMQRRPCTHAEAAVQNTARTVQTTMNLMVVLRQCKTGHGPFCGQLARDICSSFPIPKDGPPKKVSRLWFQAMAQRFLQRNAYMQRRPCSAGGSLLLITLGQRGRLLFNRAI